MTDYFALLQQPRRPSLDLEKLEEEYRELARATHPDQSTDPAGEFAEVNEAYRTLRDPKSRLQHLLTLEGRPPSDSTAEVPADLAELFMKIAPALRHKNKDGIDAINQELSDSYAGALEQLHQLNVNWSHDTTLNLIDAEKLYRRFAFLTRWKNHVEEHRFSISSAMFI